MGRLTTHILDTSAGSPARGIRFALYSTQGERKLLNHFATNDDGRMDGPLLEGDVFKAGEYELEFYAGEYFRNNTQSSDRAFLDTIVIRFYVAAPQEHYHVPLILSPFGYTTYRGS
jgi:5-hydroxyisourate hydrolase